MGMIQKKGSKNYCSLLGSSYCNFAKFDYRLHIYFYECKQNKCVHMLYCDTITKIVKEEC